MTDARVLVEVVPVEAGRQIAWGANVAEDLQERIDDVRRAVKSGTEAIAESIGDLPRPEGWRLDDVSATFGIALTAEAGVVLTKASVEATFEVTVTFTREA